MKFKRFRIHLTRILIKDFHFIHCKFFLLQHNHLCHFGIQLLHHIHFFVQHIINCSSDLFYAFSLRYFLTLTLLCANRTRQFINFVIFYRYRNIVYIVIEVNTCVNIRRIGVLT
ncbi:hypothetical protein HanPSC8_Chr09g0387821 [Helianthus annuus]|nr:hypothetical protein HanPSC8_Chr09g0387821 [Helianthus annuus]